MSVDEFSRVNIHNNEVIDIILFTYDSVLEVNHISMMNKNFHLISDMEL